MIPALGPASSGADRTFHVDPADAAASEVASAQHLADRLLGAASSADVRGFLYAGGTDAGTLLALRDELALRCADVDPAVAYLAQNFGYPPSDALLRADTYLATARARQLALLLDWVNAALANRQISHSEPPEAHLWDHAWHLAVASREAAHAHHAYAVACRADPAGQASDTVQAAAQVERAIVMVEMRYLLGHHALALQRLEEHLSRPLPTEPAGRSEQLLHRQTEINTLMVLRGTLAHYPADLHEALASGIAGTAGGSVVSATWNGMGSPAWRRATFVAQQRYLPELADALATTRAKLGETDVPMSETERRVLAALQEVVDTRDWTERLLRDTHGFAAHGDWEAAAEALAAGDRRLERLQQVQSEADLALVRATSLTQRTWLRNLLSNVTLAPRMPDLSPFSDQLAQALEGFQPFIPADASRHERIEAGMMHWLRPWPGLAPASADAPHAA